MVSGPARAWNALGHGLDHTQKRDKEKKAGESVHDELW